MEKNFDLKKFEEKYGKVYGRNTKNARIYKHSGNWANKPLMFFAADPQKAVSTALNIDASLSVWNEKNAEWDEIFDIEWLYEADEDAKEIIEEGLERIGLTRKNLVLKGVYEFAYRGYEMEDIPEGAIHLANGIYFN